MISIGAVVQCLPAHPPPPSRVVAFSVTHQEDEWAEGDSMR